MTQANRSLRLLGSSAINLVGLAIVTTTIPVFLCTSETYMEFVLNAAATLFIVELDDLTHNTTIVLKDQETASLLTQTSITAYYKRTGREDEDATWDI